MKIAHAALLIFAAAAPAFAAGPSWDSSGNSQLSGTYYFRQVLYVGSAGGAISTAVTFYGNIVFSGTTAGSYTITGGVVVESGSEPQTYGTTGTYSVSASGFGFMTSPLAAVYASGANTNVYFLVSNGILLGSDTEGVYNDMIVAAPLSSSISTSSFTGSYTISSFFPGGSPATSLGATYQLNPNGAGTLGNVSITGYTGAGSTVTQNSSGVKYVYSNGAYSITFPTNNNAYFYQGGAINNTVGDNGPVIMYISPDADFVFGGSALGFDMFVGVKNTSSGTSTPLSGLYYEAGFDDNEVSGLDSYYGSFNAIAGGNIVGHERILYAGYSPEGYTYYDSYPTSITGSFTDPSDTVNYTIAADGIRVGYGTNGYLGIEVGLPYTPPAPSGSVYISPSGIVNTASSAPYTAGISPGDFITFYNGANLANSIVFAPPGAFPTTLGGVTVLIDGLPAPIYYVSTTQVSALVPYEVSAFPIASIQIDNNGTLSNTATMYVNLTTPGVFTADPVGGIGYAAMLDFPSSGGYFVVGANNPANPGDAVAVYLTGLGLPFPSSADGALGPATGDILDQTITVDVSGTTVATPPYLGLAPALAGLYQINFTIPSTICTTTGQTDCITAGDNTLGISGPDSYSDEALIPIGSGGTAAVSVASQSSPDAAAAAKPSVRKVLPRLSRPSSRQPDLAK